jgi:hypothetical protein
MTRKGSPPVVLTVPGSPRAFSPAQRRVANARQPGELAERWGTPGETAAKKQRELARAIKRARFLGLLPYVIR